MKTLINSAAIAGAALLCAPTVFADDTETLDTVVVTASRVAETANEALVPVTVITREDIERYQSQTVVDVLRRVPGLTVAQNGGRGQLASVFMRGTNSNQVLVLINGVRVRDASLNRAPFENIPVSEIERIEVVRGPRSSLYGSDGIGGVIQIFTRAGSGTPKPFASLTAGRYGHYTAQAGFSGSENGTRYNVSVGGEETGGYDTCRANAGEGGCNPDASNENDDDGYRQLSTSVRIGKKLSPVLDTEIAFLHSDSSVEFDGAGSDSSDNLSQVISGKAVITPVEQLTITTNVGRYKEKRQSFKGDVKGSIVDSTTDSAGLQVDYYASDNFAFTVGGEYADETLDAAFVSSFGTFLSAGSRYNQAGYLQLSGTAGQVDAQLNLRRDLYEDAKSKNTGSLAFGLNLTEKLRLLASYSEAFRILALGSTANNADVKPEYSQNYEIGAQWTAGNIQTALTVYHNDVTDQITFPAPDFNPTNQTVLLRGAEISVTANYGNWLTSAAFSRIDAIDKATGEQPVRRPKYTAQIDIDRIINSHSLGLSINSNSSSKSISVDPATGEPIILGSHTLVDLRGRYQFSPAWSINALWSNIGDKRYETARFYTQPGSALNLTLRYQPQ